MAFEHTSVLLYETVDGLNVRPDGIYVDATLGGGGHASEVCRRLSSKGRLIGIDQDADAIEAAGKRLEGFGEKVTIIRSNYCDMKPRLHELGIDKVDGITLDLGVSSYQLDTAERGFSYRADAPLDMRMDQRQKMTARDIVNDYSEAELYRIIRDYGEDRFAKNIAKHIAAERDHKACDSDESAEDIRTSVQEDISGDPDRAESRTRRAEGFAGRHDRHAESRGTDLYHYISFAGGQDREKRVPQEREPMYLSESFSGLCLWKDIEREGDHKKAHPSVGGRDGGEQPVEECKAEDL